MGKWKWLNLAVLAVAGWYAYLDVFVPAWNPYEPPFQAIGTGTFRRCAAELQAAVYQDRVWYQVRFEPVTCWDDARRAWLVVGREGPLRLSGGRHHFRADVSRETENLCAGPVTLEIERWDGSREVTAFRLCQGAPPNTVQRNAGSH